MLCQLTVSQHGSALVWQRGWQPEQEEEETASSVIFLFLVLVVILREQGEQQPESEVQPPEPFSLQRQGQRQEVRRHSMLFFLIRGSMEEEEEVTVLLKCPWARRAVFHIWCWCSIFTPLWRKETLNSGFLCNQNKIAAGHLNGSFSQWLLKWIRSLKHYLYISSYVRL